MKDNPAGWISILSETQLPSILKLDLLVHVIIMHG
jgi:hypothetical protein